jgi:hypothetical protein
MDSPRALLWLSPAFFLFLLPISVAASLPSDPEDFVSCDWGDGLQVDYFSVQTHLVTPSECEATCFKQGSTHAYHVLDTGVCYCGRTSNPDPQCPCGSEDQPDDLSSTCSKTFLKDVIKIAVQVIISDTSPKTTRDDVVLQVNSSIQLESFIWNISDGCSSVISTGTAATFVPSLPTTLEVFVTGKLGNGTVTTSGSIALYDPPALSPSLELPLISEGESPDIVIQLMRGTDVVTSWSRRDPAGNTTRGTTMHSCT